MHNIHTVTCTETHVQYKHTAGFTDTVNCDPENVIIYLMNPETCQQCGPPLAPVAVRIGSSTVVTL